MFLHRDDERHHVVVFPILSIATSDFMTIGEGKKDSLSNVFNAKTCIFRGSNGGGLNINYNGVSSQGAKEAYVLGISRS